MKNFIVTMSIVALMAILICYQSDFNKFIYVNEKLQNLVDNYAVEISYQIDKEKYGEGYIVFKREYLRQVANEIHTIMTSGYFKGGYRVTLTQYNENNTKYSFVANNMNSNKTLYIDTYTDNSYDVGKYVKPRIQIFLTGANVDFKSKILDQLSLKVYKSAIVDYEGH